MQSDVNEMVPLEVGTIEVLDIDLDYIYSAFKKQQAEKWAENQVWTFRDFFRQALLTYAAGLR